MYTDRYVCLFEICQTLEEIQTFVSICKGVPSYLSPCSLPLTHKQIFALVCYLIVEILLAFPRRISSVNKCHDFQCLFFHILLLHTFRLSQMLVGPPKRKKKEMEIFSSHTCCELKVETECETEKKISLRKWKEMNLWHKLLATATRTATTTALSLLFVVARGADVCLYASSSCSFSHSYEFDTTQHMLGAHNHQPYFTEQ